MDKQTVSRFKRKLLALQQELQESHAEGKAAADTVELDQSRVGRLSRMDALQGQAMSQAINQRRQVELLKISSALQRIEADDYGYCVKCGEDIAIKRLELDPAVPLCIDCASKAEKK